MELDFATTEIKYIRALKYATQKQTLLTIGPFKFA
jgi:hypothetical protein